MNIPDSYDNHDVGGFEVCDCSTCRRISKNWLVDGKPLRGLALFRTQVAIHWRTRKIDRMARSWDAPGSVWEQLCKNGIEWQSDNLQQLFGYRATLRAWPLVPSAEAEYVGGGKEPVS